ncbi:MAG: hypothetical protein IIX30_00470, partial [Clostridia bacterium]|nr:hypothetical protein [Clostridia bacterium]
GVAPNRIRFLKKAKPKTFKLGVRAIKFEAANPDKIKSKTLDREHISVERTFLKTLKNLSARKFFAELFFKKAT